MKMHPSRVFIVIAAFAGLVLWLVLDSRPHDEVASAAGTDVPVIELDPKPPVKVPAGYRAYILRDWNRFSVIQAERVYLQDDDLHRGDELLFHYGPSDGIKAVRRPKYAGELSRVFLPVSFVLPDDVRALRAEPIPGHVRRFAARKPASFKFDEEPLPAGAPPGSRAYKANFPSFVFTGSVTGIEGRPDRGFTFTTGSNVKIRAIRKSDRDTTSHIIVLPGHALPPDFINSSL